jgi:pimeloyl-ACP methyl ester carboxylesterase
LIWGKEDTSQPFKGNERIRAVLDCEFFGVEEAGHLPHCDKPALVNDRIIKFLNE